MHMHGEELMLLTVGQKLSLLPPGKARVENWDLSLLALLDIETGSCVFYNAVFCTLNVTDRLFLLYKTHQYRYCTENNDCYSNLSI